MVVDLRKAALYCKYDILLVHAVGGKVSHWISDLRLVISSNFCGLDSLT